MLSSAAVARLHDEIVDWVIHLELTPHELSTRASIVNRVRAFCVGEYAHAEVSQSSGYVAEIHRARLC